MEACPCIRPNLRTSLRSACGPSATGDATRSALGTRPPVDPVDIVHMLADIGAWGVNLHDNDLVPIDATPSERDAIVARFKKALDDTGLQFVMGTVNLFTDPVFKDGAFTSNVPEIRRYALRKTMRGHRPRARAGRQDLRALGRPGRRRSQRRQEPHGRPSSASAKPSTTCASTSSTRATT